MTVANNTVLNTGNMLRVDFRCSHHTQKIVTMWGDDMLCWLGWLLRSHFTMYTYIKSLCCVPKTNTIVYVNYITIKLAKIKVEKKDGKKL